MLRPAGFWILTALASISALILIANVYQLNINRELRQDIERRAQFVQQSVPLEALSREIATALAQLSVQSGDEKVRAMLAALGITVTVTPATAAADAAADTPPAPSQPASSTSRPAGADADARSATTVRETRK